MEPTIYQQISYIFLCEKNDKEAKICFRDYYLYDTPRSSITNNETKFWFKEG